VQPVGRRRHRDLDGAEQHAHQRQRDHEGAHRRRPQGAAAQALGAALGGPPRPRARLGRERERGHQQHRAAGDQRRTGTPQRADRQRQRRTADPRQLDRGRLERVRGAPLPGIGNRRRQQRAQAGADRRRREPDPARQRHQQQQRSTHGQHRDEAEQHGGRSTTRHEHRRLPASIHHATEQRATDPERDGVDAGHEAGGAERPGEVLGVDEQADAEHRQREAGDDRDGEEAARVGGGGHVVDPAPQLVYSPDPESC
jgi:hypothetical protein